MHDRAKRLLTSESRWESQELMLSTPEVVIYHVSTSARNPGRAGRGTDCRPESRGTPACPEACKARADRVGPGDHSRRPIPGRGSNQGRPAAGIGGKGER